MSDEQKAVLALVDHLGRTHLAIVILCLAIVATHLFDRNEAVLRAQATVDKFASASAAWDQEVLNKAAAQRSRVVWDRARSKPGREDIVSLPLRVNGIDREVQLILPREQFLFVAKQIDAVNADPANVACESSFPVVSAAGGLSVMTPTCVRDIRYMWNSLESVNEIHVAESACLELKCIDVHVEPGSSKVEVIRTPKFRDKSDLTGGVPWLPYLELRTSSKKSAQYVVEAYLPKQHLAELGLSQLSSMKVAIDYSVTRLPFSVRRALGPTLGVPGTADPFAKAFPEFDQFTKNYDRISFEEAHLLIANELDRNTQAFDFLGVKIPAQLLGRLASFALFSLQLYLYLQLRELSRRLPNQSRPIMMSWIALYEDRAARIAAVTSIVVAPILAGSIFWVRGVLGLSDAVLLALTAALAIMIARSLWQMWELQRKPAAATPEQRND